MRLVLEFTSRYFTMETGRLIEPEFEPEPEAEEVEVIRLPLGFHAPPVTQGGTDNDEDDEADAPEADCQ